MSLFGWSPVGKSVHGKKPTPYHASVDTIQQLLLGAIDDISEVGASRFSPVTLCARLKLPPSLVNYHFGSRMGLILDASVLAYEQYVEGQSRAMEQPSPEARLQAWVESQIEWTVKHAGVASVLNFPGLTGPSNDDFSRDHQARLEAAASYNMQILGTIVGQIQGIERPDELMTEEKATRYPRVALAVAIIGWLTLGHSVWRSGHHLPTKEVAAVANYARMVSAAVVPAALYIAREVPVDLFGDWSAGQGR